MKKSIKGKDMYICFIKLDLKSCIVVLEVFVVLIYVILIYLFYNCFVGFFLVMLYCNIIIWYRYKCICGIIL